MPKPKLDELDIKILEALQEDGRLTNLELAERIGLSPSPCLRRVKRLESEGYIEGYTARINRTKVGLSVTAFVEAKLERHTQKDADTFEKTVRQLPHVLSCHLISGRPDYLLEIVLTDLDQYSVVLKTLRSIPRLQEVHSSFVLAVVKPNSRLPLNFATSPDNEE